jgi:hypothetical protein
MADSRGNESPGKGPTAPHKAGVVVGSAPVNRRYARPLSAPVVRPAALNPRAALRQTNTSLARTFSGAAPKPNAARWLRAGAAALAATAAFAYAGLQASTVSALAGVALLALAAFGARRPSAQEIAARPICDAATLQRVDRLIGEVSAELPPDALAHLANIQATLTRLARPLAQLADDPAFSAEDRYYISATLARYLPDSLAAYLALPAAQRRMPLAEGDGKTAEQLVSEQLRDLAAELALRERRLAECVAGALLRQSRFIAARRSGG